MCMEDRLQITYLSGRPALNTLCWLSTAAYSSACCQRCRLHQHCADRLSSCLACHVTQQIAVPPFQITSLTRPCCRSLLPPPLPPAPAALPYCLALPPPSPTPLHCSHLVEHEDNEMMVPWCVGQPGYKNPKNHTELFCPGPN
jgi:hypothetical protein